MPRLVGLTVGMVALAGCAGANSRASVPTPRSTGTPGLGVGEGEAGATGAIVTVTAEDLRGQHIGSVEELFLGRVAGLQVVNGMIRIRGAAQDMMVDGGEPLLILDGMPARGSVFETLRGLNPNEIEKIQVLKDVSSTAVFGTRGASGVILVTLRRD